MSTLGPPPVQQSVTKLGNFLQDIWSRWIQNLFSFVQNTSTSLTSLTTTVGNLTSYAGSVVQVPLTGFSITMGSVNVLTLNPAGTLATGTVTTPASPWDGMSIEIASTQIVTSFTLSANAGQSIKNAPTALSAGPGVGFYYNLATTTWYRRY